MLVEQAAIEASPPKSSLQLLRDRTVRWQLITLSTIYFCNQMSGMSAVSVMPPPAPPPRAAKPEHVRALCVGPWESLPASPLLSDHHLLLRHLPEGRNTRGQDPILHAVLRRL